MPVGAMPISEPAETEAERIARGLRRRDLALLNELVERYQYRLVRYLIYLTARREAVDDWVQETWLRVLDRAAQIVREPAVVLDERMAQHTGTRVEHRREQRGVPAVHVGRAHGAAGLAIAGHPARDS